MHEGWNCNPLCCTFHPTCCHANNIPAMITKNTIRYRCPVTDIATKDDVHISIDIGINFHIGESEETFEEDCQRFFYNFGPNRLSELLCTEVDEDIRDFVRKTKVKNVSDMKTELTNVLLNSMKAKFIVYGVVIENIAVMNVIIPKELRESLSAATNFDVYLQKQVKLQENKMLKMVNTENKAILKLKRDNMQILFKFQHDIDVEEINCLDAEITLETN